MGAFSSMSAITIFVVSDGATSQAARALVESWTQSGILDSSLWVSPSGIGATASGPPSITATHVHSGGTQTVSLFDHVGRFRLDVVRVVAAHLILHDGATDKSLDVAATTVADTLAAALPRRTGGNHDSGTRLHRSMIVIPVSGASGATIEVTKPDWEVNAVISPEDRPDLDRASVFVRHPGNFEGHAANALAAVGGILRGIPAGVLDDLSSDSTTADGDVVVARISIRAVVGEDMLDDVATRVLDANALAPVGPASVLHWARPASHPGVIASEAAAFVLSGPEWAPTEPPSRSSSFKNHQSVFRAIRTAALFNVRTAGAVISWFVSRGRAGAERGATEAIVGATAGTLVNLGPKPVDDLTYASERLLKRERSRTSEDLTLQSTRLGAPAATTWSGLRSLSFALADGGDLGDFPEPRQANKRELLPAQFIAVHPDAVWPEPVLRASDPSSMREHRGMLEVDVADARVAFSVAETALKNAQKARADNPPVNTTDGDPYWPDDATLEALSKDVAEAESDLKNAEAAHDDFAVWFDAQASSMLWQVGDDVGRRIEGLQKAQDEIEAKDEKQVPPADLLRKAQRTLELWWGWTVFPWLTIGLAYVYLYVGELPPSIEPWRPDTESFIVGEVVLACLAMTILIAANHSFYKAVRAYEWNVENLVHRIRNDRSFFLYAGREKARLEFLYETLRDWSEIVGEALHRPWDSVERTYQQLPDSVIDALPASTGLARQSDDDGAITTGILMQAYDRAYTRGFATRQFELAYAAWEEEQPSGSSEGYRPTDLDTLVNASSPRRRLLDFWRHGSARNAITKRATRDLHDAVQSGQLSLPTRRVERLGRFGDGETYSERDFFAAMASESTAFTTDVFTSSAQLARRHYVERSIAWLPGAARSLAPDERVEVRESLGSTAVRVDISKRISAAELAPFAAETLRIVTEPEQAPLSSAFVPANDDGTPWH